MSTWQQNLFLSNNWTVGQAKTAEVAELNAIYYLILNSYYKTWNAIMQWNSPAKVADFEPKYINLQQRPCKREEEYVYSLKWLSVQTSASNKHRGCRLNHKGPQTICCDRNVRTLGASQVCPFPPVAVRCIVSLFHALDKICLHFCHPLGSKITLSVMEVGRETQQHIPFETTDRRKW